MRSSATRHRSRMDRAGARSTTRLAPESFHAHAGDVRAGDTRTCAAPRRAATTWCRSTPRRGRSRPTAGAGSRRATSVAPRPRRRCRSIHWSTESALRASRLRGCRALPGSRRSRPSSSGCRCRAGRARRWRRSIAGGARSLAAPIPTGRIDRPGTRCIAGARPRSGPAPSTSNWWTDGSARSARRSRAARTVRTASCRSSAAPARSRWRTRPSARDRRRGTRGRRRSTRRRARGGRSRR